MINLDKADRYFDEASEQSINAFMEDMKPVAFKLCYSNAESLVPAKLKTSLKGRSLLWYNTLWTSLCAGHHDDLAIENPNGTSDFMIDSLSAHILQTDRPQFILENLRSRNLHK